MEATSSGQSTTPAHKRATDGGRAAKVITCINPATGTDLGEVPVFSEQRIEAAVQDARAAFRSWRRTTFAERAELILRVRDLVLSKQDEILDALTEETGKVRADAMTELLAFCDTVGYYAKNAHEFLADERLSVRLLKNKRVRSVYAPRGLVVNIAPWNFPLDLAMTETIPALMAGNVVIVKPSEVTPRIALKMLELFREAGIPKHVLQVVTGFGEAGAKLIEQADFVCFTGSVGTGRKVAVACAQRLVPCTLELGGKDPFIVLEDANLERAARGAVWGAFLNSGQVCMSVERVYVVESIYDRFVDRVVQLTKELRQGVDVDGHMDVGSMIDPRQIEIVSRHVEEARERGARILAGGRLNPNLGESFYEPTVLVDVDESMAIMREETFGPVLPIQKVRDAEEALRLANDSDFGLNASVWSSDKARAEAMARELESGAVCINDCIVSYEVTEAPYGGVKHSGIGRRKGPDGIRKYCNQKTVLNDLFGLKREPIWYPYSAKVTDGLKNALRLLYQRGLRNKMSAVRDLVGL